MATMFRHDHSTTTRPAWPDDTRQGDAIDLRDERDARIEHADPDDAHLVRARHVAPARRRGAGALHALGFVLAAVLLCAIAVFAVANRSDEIRIDAVYDTLRMPLWAIIGIVGAVGFAAGRMLDRSDRC